MIHNMVGGGAALNFKVVGNPQPEHPRENTIWVDTDSPIAGWLFASKQPEIEQEGMVWIQTGTTGPVMLNALKKNGIQLCPLYAMQYSSGAWTRKNAQFFAGGVWQSLSHTLRLEADNWAVLPNAAYGHTFSYGNDSLTFAASQGYSNTWQSAGRYYKEKLDLTHYKTMTVDLIFTHSGGGNVKFGLTRDLTVSDLGSAPAVVVRDYSSTGQLQLDISALSGEYYAAMNMYIGSNTVMSAVIGSIVLS